MKLSEKIQKINQKGIENLNTKGISIPGDSTTDTIMDNILNIVNGGESVVYSNIVYNDDGTITLTEVNGTVRTMTCEYDGDKMVSATYDGETINLTYEDDVLVSVGDISVDMSKAPATSGGVISVCNAEIPTEDVSIKSFDILGPITFSKARGINDYAFQECISLTKIDLPVVSYIGNGAFQSCTNLTDVSAPSLAEYIGGYAFYDCISLTEINLPLATSIGGHAFRNCTNLTKVDLPSATSVSDAAFYDCTSLTKVDLPLVNSIGGSAFNECTSLTEVNLPSLVSIGGNVFNECTSLIKADLPLLTSVSNYTFDDCTNLTKVYLPSATSIGKGAFRRCTNLTKVNLPLTTNIDADAFWKCENLEAVILRTTETVCTIHTNAFAIDATAEGVPTKFNDNFYVPTSMFEQYRAAYEPTFNQMGFTGLFDTLFHKIEDYPEICE